jgi:thiol-disulfide isomerase/thioredoxin
MQQSDTKTDPRFHRRRTGMRVILAAFASVLGSKALAQPGASLATSDAFGPATPLGRLGDEKDLTTGELRPRALVVCFWASWCPHCRNEMVVLERVQRAVSVDQLRVVMVNTENASDWRPIRRRLEGQVSVLLTHDADARVRKAFTAPDSVPFTVVLNRDGSQRATLKGWSDNSLNRLLEHVNAALASTPRQS